MRKLLYGMAICAVAITSPAVTLAGEAEDSAIAQRIAASFKSSGQMQGYKVGVAVQDGRAWLNGTVASQEQMEIALEIARTTAGVEEVVNQLSTTSEQRAASSRLKSPINNEPAVRLAGNQEASSLVGPAPIVGGPAYEARRTSAGAPLPFARAGGQQVGYGQPIPAHVPGPGYAPPARYDHPHMPNYAWPSYASHPNYAGLTYPKQYSPTAWPFIGPFYPYPQVPLGWRKVSLEWDDGWWFLDFHERHHHH